MFDNQEEADNVAGTLTSDNYLEVWNTIRSQQADPNATSMAFASELFRRTEDDLATSFSPEFATAVFDQEIDTPTPVIAVTGQDGTISYFIAIPSGKEMLPLTDAAYQTKKDELVSALITSLRGGNVIVQDFWRDRVPTKPALDDKFYATPTPVPEQPIVPEVATPASTVTAP